MFQRILIPVDLTPKNNRAVEVARDLAGSPGCEVFLLHVIETLDLPFEELEDFYGRLEKRATEQLQPLAAILDSAEVAVSGHIVYGKRAEKVIEFAQDHSADLIILDSHRIEPGKLGKGLATLSYQIAIVAQCPVLLVKGRSTASDDSPISGDFQ